MSSPDFLKRYRNNEDWPEIGEEEEEEGKKRTRKFNIQKILRTQFFILVIFTHF